MSNPVNRISASRIKVLKSCSWSYWCKYFLKLPEKNNDGAKRGTICHDIFEYFGPGGKRREAQYKKIIDSQDAFAPPAVKKKILEHAKKLEVDDEENIAQIKDMVLAGLLYDFWGQGLGDPVEAHSELVFNIVDEAPNGKYAIYGFLDKVFVYDNPKRILIRDFKTSKKVFEGGEVTDNQQDLIYRLAMMKKFGEDYDIGVEFLFLKFGMEEGGEGVMKMDPVSREELYGYEVFLAEVQKKIDNFDLNEAMKNLAYYQDWPKKGGGFCGPLMCGFAKKKGQLKKDGSIMWHCPFKFDFNFVKVYDKTGKLVERCFKEDFNEDIVPEGGKYEVDYYAGCPAYR